MSTNTVSKKVHIDCDWNDYIEKKLNEKHSNFNCYLQKLMSWMRKKLLL